MKVQDKKSNPFCYKKNNSRTKQFLSKPNIGSLVTGQLVKIFTETLNSHLPIEQINLKCYINKALKLIFKIVLARVKLTGYIKIIF